MGAERPSHLSQRDGSPLWVAALCSVLHAVRRKDKSCLAGFSWLRSVTKIQAAGFNVLKSNSDSDKNFYVKPSRWNKARAAQFPSFPAGSSQVMGQGTESSPNPPRWDFEPSLVLLGLEKEQVVVGGQHSYLTTGHRMQRPYQLVSFAL